MDTDFLASATMHGVLISRLVSNIATKLQSLQYVISKQYCTHWLSSNIKQTFHFQSFASSMTNFFLPWLTLCAQLPYETESAWHNFMSFCLAVGSPALITYSLTITILNRLWLRRSFGELRFKASMPAVHDKYNGYDERIRACQFLLEEGQQVPLRASQEKGWLSSLVVIPDNSSWWTGVEDRLKSTRRGVTYSLVAQLLFAAIAYLFTVIVSFETALGDPTTALQISSGSLWIWLVR